MAALFWKEFRETVRWFPFCLLLVVVLLLWTVPGAKGIYGVDRLSDSLVTAAGAAAFIVAVALAGAQFAFDQQTSARAFLFHRKQSARQIFHAKVAVGALFYALAVFVPLTYTAFYLEWMGPERLPTTWFQTVPAMAFCFFCFSFYFGVSLAINRPVRWLGTRLLPLFASALTTLTYLLVSAPTSMIAMVSIAVGMSLLLMLAFASRAAFESGQNCDASANMKVMLFLSSLAAASAALATPAFFAGSTENSWRDVAIDENGDPWLVNVNFILGMGDQRTERWPLVEDASQIVAQEVPEEWAPGSIDFYPMKGRNERPWDFKELHQTDDGVWFLDNDGRILAYEYRGTQKGAVGFRVIGRKSIDGSSVQNSKRFKDPEVPLILSGIKFIVDAHGVYASAPKEDQCYTLLNQPIDAVRHWKQGDSNGSDWFVFSIVSGTTVTIYHLESSDSNPSGFKLVLDQTLNIEKQFGSYRSNLGFTGPPKDTEPTNWTWVDETSFNNYRVTRKRTSDEKPISYTCKLPAEQTSSINRMTIGSVTSVSMCVFVLLEMAFARQLNTVLLFRSEYVVEPLWSAAPMIAVMAILSTIVTYAMARVRRLSKRQQIVWSLIGFVSGLGAALAVIAIYPQVYSAHCARCGRKRRIERELCEHCGAEWEQPASDGIEIIEPFVDKHEAKELMTH